MDDCGQGCEDSGAGGDDGNTDIAISASLGGILIFALAHRPVGPLTCFAACFWSCSWPCSGYFACNYTVLVHVLAFTLDCGPCS